MDIVAIRLLVCEADLFDVNVLVKFGPAGDAGSNAFEAVVVDLGLILASLAEITFHYKISHT